MTCPILMAADGGYAMQLATALRSLAESNVGGWPLQVSVLVVAFPDVLRQRVVRSLPEGSIELNWVAVEDQPFGHLFAELFESKMTYLRLLATEVLPDSASRALYLDADILVLADLGPLSSLDMEGMAVAAADDGLDAVIQNDDPGYRDLPRVERYFNAGILLIDLDHWRRENLLGRMLWYLREHPGPRYRDQDVLNVMCDGKWKRLDRRWNYIDLASPADQYRRPPMALPAIMHFAVWNKPWDYFHPNPHAALYDAFRSRTAFARSPAERQRDTLKSVWGGSKRLARSLVAARPAMSQPKNTPGESDARQ